MGDFLWDASQITQSLTAQSRLLLCKSMGGIKLLCALYSEKGSDLGRALVHHGSARKVVRFRQTKPILTVFWSKSLNTLV